MFNLKIMIPLLILLLLSAAVISYKVFVYESKDKLVPRVSVLNLDEAIAVLESRGLDYRVTKIGDTEPNPDDPVIRQEPIAGTRVWDDMVVELIVSNRPMPLPEIDSLNVAEAVRLTNEYGFEVADTLYAYDDYIPEGLVVGYKDRSTTTVLKTPVTIIVSKGVSWGTIPRVTGIHAQRAEKKLRDAGFSNIEFSMKPDKKLLEGYVLDVQPSSGRYRRDTTIHVTVSSGS